MRKMAVELQVGDRLNIPVRINQLETAAGFMLGCTSSTPPSQNEYSFQCRPGFRSPEPIHMQVENYPHLIYYLGKAKYLS